MSTPREMAGSAADRARDELVVTIKELDRRREAALDVRGQLLRHQTLVVTAATVAAIAVLGGVVYGVLHASRRRRRLPATRVRSLLRAWEHPERLARKRPQAGSSVAVKAAQAAVGVAVSRLVAVAFDRLSAPLEGRRPSEPAAALR